MKLIDAIKQVKRPESRGAWDNAVEIEEVCTELALREIWNAPNELYDRFKQYPLFNWLCTDEMVGLYALYLDGEPVGAYYRPGRKMSYNFMWLSQEAASTVRACLVSYMAPDTVSIITPDIDTTDFLYYGEVDTQLNVDDAHD